MYWTFFLSNFQIKFQCKNKFRFQLSKSVIPTQDQNCLTSKQRFYTKKNYRAFKSSQLSNVKFFTFALQVSEALKLPSFPPDCKHVYKRGSLLSFEQREGNCSERIWDDSFQLQLNPKFQNETQRTKHAIKFHEISPKNTNFSIRTFPYQLMQCVTWQVKNSYAYKLEALWAFYSLSNTLENKQHKWWIRTALMMGNTHTIRGPWGELEIAWQRLDFTCALSPDGSLPPPRRTARASSLAGIGCRQLRSPWLVSTLPHAAAADSSAAWAAESPARPPRVCGGADLGSWMRCRQKMQKYSSNQGAKCKKYPYWALVAKCRITAQKILS